MKFHNITTCDMLNGDGLRVVLWLSGCEIHCDKCQNPETWDCNVGVEFDDNAKQELFSYLKEDYISGITFSGGHPLHENNIKGVSELIDEIREKFPNKTIWIYSGYEFQDIFTKSIPRFYDGDTKIWDFRVEVISKCDVLVDGPFIHSKLDNNFHWAGSTNQRVINVKKTMENILNNESLCDLAGTEYAGYGTFSNSVEKCIVLYDNI